MKASIGISIAVWVCASAAAPACVVSGAGEHGAEAEGRLGADGAGGAGAGCAPPAGGGCLFGEVYGDLAERPGLRVDGAGAVTAATLDELAPEDQARLVRAVQQSAHTDVTTPLEAIERVDGGEIRVTRVSEPAARRRFVAFEYGVGGRSFGAIFEPVSDAMVSRIRDGDLVRCTVRRETCLLPEDYAALRASAAFERTSQRAVTAAWQLAGIEAAQALAALRRVYGAGTTIESGLAQADGGALNIGAYRHRASGREVVVFELGAGDTSMGSIYYAGATRLAGVIRDLFIEGCTLFEPGGG